MIYLCRDDEVLGEMKEKLATAAAVAAVVIAGAALSGCALGGDSSNSDDFRGFQSTGPQLPTYWGATIGDQFTGTAAPWDMRPVVRLEDLVGKRMSLVGFSNPFADCTGARCTFIRFPLTPLENVREHGSIPFFSWGSERTPTVLDQPRFRLRNISDGEFDPFIRQFARGAAAWGQPFFLRLDWEMNGEWFPWAESVNGNRSGDFVRAWRHIHDIFDSVGADNVTWVWCPNVSHDKNLGTLYPGDQYVDWTCLDGFNWGPRPNASGWLSFGKLFRASYQQLRQIAPDKPTILGEVASSNYGGNKAAWIHNMLRRIPPGIRGFLWYNANDQGANWPLELASQPLAAFRDGIKDPLFVSNRYGSLTSSPIRPPAPGE